MSAALAGLLDVDELVVSLSILTRLLGLVIVAAAAAACVGSCWWCSLVASDAVTSSALLFLVGLMGLDPAVVLVAVVVVLPTRLQKSA